MNHSQCEELLLVDPRGIKRDPDKVAFYTTKVDDWEVELQYLRPQVIERTRENTVDKYKTHLPGLEPSDHRTLSTRSSAGMVSPFFNHTHHMATPFDLQAIFRTACPFSFSCFQP